jgi:hypothetical protein
VIAEELYRNICLAFLCILVTTLFLLFDVLACVFVLLAVAHTIVNVAGFMHFWGEPGLPDFTWCNIPKWGKMYQITANDNKL